jgi:thiol-disulfide isomerase/thioredoxin
VLKKLLIVVVALLGFGITGLVTYSYFFLQRSPESLAELRDRAEQTELDRGRMIITFSRGRFIDRDAEVNAEVTAPYPGYRAPDFAFEDLDGNTVRLSELRGKPVLLNFWATWCPPCRKEIPDLQKFYEQYGDRITLLGIDWGEDAEEVKRFLRRYGATYTNLLDKDGKFFVLYRLTGLPSSYWIDEEGIIRGLWLGAMEIEDMVEGFRKTTRAFEDER